MGEVVNLRTARKAKARQIRAVEADANRAVFGRTRAERTADEAVKARIAKTLDGAKRED